MEGGDGGDQDHDHHEQHPMQVISPSLSNEEHKELDTAPTEAAPPPRQLAFLEDIELEAVEEGRSQISSLRFSSLPSLLYQ